MSKATVQFSDYVSLAVMLLMVVAFVAGQTDASAYAVDNTPPVAPTTRMDDRMNMSFDGHLDGMALHIGIAVATDLSHFRGEDE